jgi:KaiC/GvpD/RAD55 family RecA-like ATPase/tetratricopeptide (TPR) repeat protein
VEEILSQAERLEKEYDWTETIRLYERALKLVSQDDVSSVREIHERSGYASYRSAFQAKDNEEFRERVNQAIVSYEKAKELHRKLTRSENEPQILRCEAMIAYLRYWLTLEGPEKKTLLDESCGNERKIVEAYNENGDLLQLGKACIRLACRLSYRLDLELDMQTRENILTEAISLGEKAMQIFSHVKNERELARAYYVTSVNCFDAAMSLRSETKRKECEQKAFEHAREAVRISEKIGDAYLLSWSTVSLGSIEHDLGGGVEAGSTLFNKALQYSSKANDCRIISETLDGLAYSTAWSMTWKENQKEIEETSARSEEYADKAIAYGVIANYNRAIFHSYAYGYTGNLRGVAENETELEARREFLKRAIDLGKKGLDYAQRVGSTHAFFHITSELSHALYNLSTITTGPEKRQLLVEAMTLGEKSVQYTEQLRPQYALPRSIPYEALALTLLELSRLEDKRENKKELLERAVSAMRTCIELCEKHIASFPSRRELFALLAGYQTELGNISNQLYQITAEKEILKKLVETYQNAVRLNKNADIPTRAAEAYWQTAVIYDRLGEYVEAANNFESASKQFELGAHSTPQLSSFCADYVTYMEAWSCIERAKYSHEREEYSNSKDSYEKAATHLNSSKSWTYLAPNYSAWAYLEQAEDLSRNDQSQESIHAFEEAAKLFGQARKSIEARQNSITALDEKELASKLIKASNVREDYCVTRVLIEEAKNLYASGDCASSGEKYALAARKLDGVLQIMETEAEVRELRSMIYMCQAWQKMSVADEMADASLYAEASSLFAKAKESSVKKRTAMLAAGNSGICRALELGANYKSTRNVILYYEAKHYMESASDYYMDAGFGNASTWVSATEALFDAYFYMDKAETEADHKDKTKFYGLVEGYLDRSAKLFNKAGYTKKANDVLRTLERVKEKREFALSLDKVLVAPAVTSSTMSMSVPTPSHEEAVGLERFEHADVQANLIIRQKDLKVGENLEIQIELVNSGKGSALLTKITEIIPKDFKLTEKPETYRAEDSYLNLKGKRLDPLKTEEVKLTLRPNAPGVFSLKPVILYLDESGRYKSHQLEPVNITVKEQEINITMPEDSEHPKDRVATGHKTLDRLLIGGIPQNYAVIVTSPPCDERDLLIKDFIETGLKKDEATFYITMDLSAAKLAEKSQPNLHLFICNPQAETITKDMPNVSKLKGVENLTDISIALASAIRKLDPSLKGPKRICIDLVSDVLLQHHAFQTRRWLTSTIAELESAGFTTLAVIDPRIHSPEELYAILGLFEGEISIFEKETKKGSAKYLKIKKMSNRKYLEDELLLKKEQQ